MTGASRGIGRATVECLAEAGWQVVAGVRRPDQLEPFDHPWIHVVKLDVTEASEVHSGVKEAEHVSGGALDCVVSNAGWALFGAIEDVDLDAARREYETNVFGAVAVLQQALPAMRRAGRGAIVAVSTIVGRVPIPFFGMYGATKLSLAAVHDALGVELAAYGIRSTVIEAGVVATDFARSTEITGSAGAPDGPYSTARDIVLGRVREAREARAIDPGDVSRAILAVIEQSDPPARVVLNDGELGSLVDAVGGPDARSHRLVGEFFGLDRPPPSPEPGS